jgi:hypothetical protein
MHGQRTGGGRRARDRILAGQTAPSPVLCSRYDMQNMVLFLGDDLRESALAMGGIEAFLLRARDLLQKTDLTPADLEALLSKDDVVERIDLLSDALSSLRRSVGLIHDRLK